ncbi:hypothetical protein ACFL6I_00275 [candidate division KSB1 bacterium]
MSLVEYCDNVNCRYNAEFRCTEPEVMFDDNAICVTALYESDETGVSDESAEVSYPPDGKVKSEDQPEDSWIKYI